MTPGKAPRSVSDSSASSYDDISLAWAGGFVDGEGCIHIAKQASLDRRRISYRLGVHISQNNRPVLEHFCEAVGLAAPIHELKHVVGRRRTCYTLNYTGKFARLLIERLLPHLVRKRDEALASLDFWSHGQVGLRRGGPRGLDPALVEVREHYYQLLKQLK